MGLTVSPDGCGNSLPPPPPGYDTRTACPVVSRYNNYTIPAHQSQVSSPPIFLPDNQLRGGDHIQANIVIVN